MVALKITTTVMSTTQTPVIPAATEIVETTKTVEVTKIAEAQATLVLPEM